jgi:uncharacterized membrane protein
VPDHARERFADLITRFSGSMSFVYAHAVWFTVWIAANVVGGSTFDAYPFGLLTMIVSLEAIFLSTFILISQNRQSDRASAHSRFEFVTDVQSDVYSELIAEHLGIDRAEVDRRVAARLAEDDRAVLEKPRR